MTKKENKSEPKFKVGDKVILDPYPCVVTDVNWRDSLHGFVYTVRGTDFGMMVGEEDLTFDTSEETYDFLKTDKSNKPSLNDCMGFLNNEITLPQGYQFKDEDGNVINATKIVLEKKKKEYPKTYEECCKVLGIDNTINHVIGTHFRYRDRIMSFIKLLICRDAYWKIAGEEMGLGKPWEPDWKNQESLKYCIAGVEGQIKTAERYIVNTILAFPTAEMRDAFHEVFREEIEICKELL